MLILNAVSDSSDRARLVLTIFLVIVGLIAAFLVMALVGTGLKAIAVRVKKATFSRPPFDPSGELKPGPLVYAWGTFAVFAACLAFILSAGWLWIVAIGAGGFLALVAGWGDEDITN